MSEVQTRHDDIKKIEKTIVELHQLFMDMQMMVEQQKEVVEQIEQNADTTANDLEQGTKLVTRAVKTAKATRAVSIRVIVGKKGFKKYMLIYAYLL
jgi:syntaxin 1B/2/3